MELHQASAGDINIALLDKAEAALIELKALADRSARSNLLAQFALSRKTKSLLEEASKCFTEAKAKLQLGIAVSQFGINLRIDENVSVIMRYVHYYLSFATNTTQHDYVVVYVVMYVVICEMVVLKVDTTYMLLLLLVFAC
jgi:hypothetical protein